MAVDVGDDESKGVHLQSARLGTLLTSHFGRDAAPHIPALTAAAWHLLSG